jgi:hypothetical protein
MGVGKYDARVRLAPTPQAEAMKPPALVRAA